MVIFYGYVSLPEGKEVKPPCFPPATHTSSELEQTWWFTWSESVQRVTNGLSRTEEKWWDVMSFFHADVTIMYIYIYMYVVRVFKHEQYGVKLCKIDGIGWLCL